MSASTPKTSMVNNVKLYVFPALVTIIATLIWRDVTEMRSDVKMLLAQSNVDKTKIEQLERDVKSLEQAVFSKKITVAHTESNISNIWFKHEDIFDVNEYTPKS